MLPTLLIDLSNESIHTASDVEIFSTTKRRAQMEKEIESMRSEHEMERTEKNEKIAQNKHVIITENKCQLYETNDEPTLDEEIEQAELLMLREDL
uniref:Uncharacterized protein n=1 Tax=Parascaris equorum TaxID=6256 RepID=A0A914R6M4_PAREQ